MRVVIFAAVFLGGAVLMALEILAFRLMAPTFGGALRETSAVIAVFLAAMTAGYYAGGAAGDRRPGVGTLAVIFAAAAGVAALVPVVCDAVNPRVSASTLPLALHAIAASVLVFFLPAFLLAAVSPVAIRLLSRDAATAGRTAGTVSAFSAAGSIAGTILAGFGLINWFSIPVAVWILAAALAGMALTVWISGRFRGASGTAALLVALASIPADARSEEIIFEKQSAYHRIRVADKDDGWRVLHFDNTRQSGMKRDDPLVQFEYADYFHTVFLFKKDIRRVLFVGLGGGSGPKRFLHDYPDVAVDAVEIDPAVVDVARKYFQLPDDKRLTVTTMDGRVYVNKTDRVYDVIFMDAYVAGRYGCSVPFHLTTKEFFKEASAKLAPDGLLVYNLACDFEHLSPRFSKALYKTLGAVFPRQYVFSAKTTYNTVLVALKKPENLSRQALLDKAKALVKEKKVVLPDYTDRVANLNTTVIRTDESPILTDKYAPVDELMQ
ncbi:MAG: fused MFS/spermidine synthase [Planctomycetota bacterium]